MKMKSEVLEHELQEAVCCTARLMLYGDRCSDVTSCDQPRAGELNASCCTSTKREKKTKSYVALTASLFERNGSSFSPLQDPCQTILRLIACAEYRGQDQAPSRSHYHARYDLYTVEMEPEIIFLYYCGWY